MNDAGANNTYICRLCLKFNRKTISLYNTRNLESLRINKFIQQLCSIQLKQDEPFPKCICYPCKVRVLSTQEFINTCKESDKTLRKIYYTNNVKGTDLQQSTLQVDIKDKEFKETKVEPELNDETLGRKRSLRSSTKIALIASLPSLITNSNTDVSFKSKQNIDFKNLSDKKFKKIKDDFIYEVENNSQDKEEVIEDKITLNHKCNKNEDSFIKQEPYLNYEDNNSHSPETKLDEDVTQNTNNSENNKKDDVHTTIKEELIIPDNENDVTKLYNSQITSEDLVLVENQNNISIKNEPGDENSVGDEELIEEDGNIESWNLQNSVNNESDEEFKQKIECEQTLTPIISDVKSESGFYHKITSCPICNRIYDRKGNLYNHLKLQHSFLSMKEINQILNKRKETFIRENLTCIICNEKFNSRSTFNDHQAAHPGHTMLVQCENCDASFTSLNSKRRHQQLSCNKPYECLFCSTKFRTFKDFRIHINIHKN